MRGSGSGGPEADRGGGGSVGRGTSPALPGLAGSQTIQRGLPNPSSEDRQDSRDGQAGRQSSEPCPPPRVPTPCPGSSQALAQPGGDPTPRGPGTEAGLSPPERLHRGPGSPTRPRGPGGQGGSPVSEDLSPDARGGTHSGSSVPMRCPPLHHPHPAPKRKRLGEAGSNPDSRLPLTRQPGPQSARPRGAGRNTASCRPCPPPPPQ